MERWEGEREREEREGGVVAAAVICLAASLAAVRGKEMEDRRDGSSDSRW